MTEYFYLSNDVISRKSAITENKRRTRLIKKGRFMA